MILGNVTLNTKRNYKLTFESIQNEKFNEAKSKNKLQNETKENVRKYKKKKIKLLTS